jgi:hypothetical protein
MGKTPHSVRKAFRPIVVPMKNNAILRSCKNLLRVAAPAVKLHGGSKNSLNAANSRRPPTIWPGRNLPAKVDHNPSICRTLPAKTPPPRRPLTFGDFVAGAYCAWGKRRAKGFIQLTLKAHIVEFLGQQRFVFS